MSLNTIFTSGTNSDGGLETGAFIIIVFAIVFAWSTISVWIRIQENFFFNTLGFDPRSTMHSLIIGFLTFCLFFVFIWFVDKLEIIPVSVATSELSQSTSGLIPAAEADDIADTMPSSTLDRQLAPIGF